MAKKFKQKKYMVNNKTGKWVPFNAKILAKTSMHLMFEGQEPDDEDYETGAEPAKEGYSVPDVIPQFLKQKETGRFFAFSPEMASRPDMEVVDGVPDELKKVSEDAKARAEKAKAEEEEAEKNKLLKQSEAMGLALKDALSAGVGSQTSSGTPSGTEKTSTQQIEPSTTDPKGQEALKGLTDEEIEKTPYKELKTMLSGSFTGNPSTEELIVIAKQLRDSLGK
jgi:hypothetical protein